MSRTLEHLKYLRYLLISTKNNIIKNFKSFPNRLVIEVKKSHVFSNNSQTNRRYQDIKTYSEGSSKKSN